MNWYMLTLVGKDQSGIVARVSEALYDGGCNLGEASMLRLGENFTIMLMVASMQPAEAVKGLIEPLATRMQLQMHLHAIDGTLHQHLQPDVQITIYGADRAGIVAGVTGRLAEAGLNITDLESRVGGSGEKPIYVMQIEGLATAGIEALEEAMNGIRSDGVEAHLQPIELMIG